VKGGKSPWAAVQFTFAVAGADRRCEDGGGCGSGVCVTMP
jgi:hypothetical protein